VPSRAPACSSATGTSSFDGRTLEHGIRLVVVWLRDLLGGFDHQQRAGWNTGIGGRLVAGIGKLLILREPLTDDFLG
jgi:hypothetical protein